MSLRTTSVYIFGPDGQERHSYSLEGQRHIPREGETIRFSDTTRDEYEEGKMLVVTNVENEYRKQDSVIGDTTHMKPMVYVQTKCQ